MQTNHPPCTAVPWPRLRHLHLREAETLAEQGALSLAWEVSPPLTPCPADCLAGLVRAQLWAHSGHDHGPTKGLAGTQGSMRADPAGGPCPRGQEKPGPCLQPHGHHCSAWRWAGSHGPQTPQASPPLASCFQATLGPVESTGIGDPALRDTPSPRAGVGPGLRPRTPLPVTWGLPAGPAAPPTAPTPPSSPHPGLFLDLKTPLPSQGRPVWRENSPSPLQAPAAQVVAAPDTLPQGPWATGALRASPCELREPQAAPNCAVAPQAAGGAPGPAGLAWPGQDTQLLGSPSWGCGFWALTPSPGVLPTPS